MTSSYKSVKNVPVELVDASEKILGSFDNGVDICFYFGSGTTISGWKKRVKKIHKTYTVRDSRVNAGPAVSKRNKKPAR